MKRQGPVAKAAEKYKATTESDHDLSAAPNILEQDFSAGAPNQKLACGKTCLWTGEGWPYLAAALDLFSRVAVGWAMDKGMKAALFCDADANGSLAAAHSQRRYGPLRSRQPVLPQAIPGSLLSRHDLICSICGKGNCYDNAAAESFLHTLKMEIVHGESFQTREAMRRAVLDYIELTRIEPEDKVPTATSARGHLKIKRSLNKTSVVHW